MIFMIETSKKGFLKPKTVGARDYAVACVNATASTVYLGDVGAAAPVEPLEPPEAEEAEGVWYIIDFHQGSPLCQSKLY
jgi:hypothetical protein